MKDFESAFTRWAASQADLRAACVVGSQARRDHPADEWSDLDLILLVTDVEKRFQDTGWLSEIAPLWLSRPGRTVAGEPEQLALFEGALQVDFVFHPISVAPALKAMIESGNIDNTLRRGAHILFDKDSLFPPLPEPTPLPAANPPGPDEFRQELEAFWFSAVHCAKQLRRGELWLFEDRSGGMLWPLLRMVEWQARLAHGWDYDTWHGGKFLAEWADAPVYTALRRVFARLDAQDGWAALHARLDLFHNLARQIAVGLGYNYPEALEKAIVKSILAIQKAI